MNVILASASPRRKELLEEIVSEFQIIPSDKEEIINNTIPEEIVKELANQKAMDIYETINTKITKTEKLIVLGADTIVSLNNKILGKPKDEEEAFSMLNDLQGNTHDVYTGVCTIIRNNLDVTIDVFSEKTNVTINPISKEEIIEYIKTGEPFDKAGAYGIQGKFKKYISGINGDYYNVMGLPIAKIWERFGQELTK